MRLPTNQLVEKYKDNIFAIAFNICKNPEDAEDITQDTFVEYFSSRKDFKDEEHIRAWLIRVTINKSKNILKAFWRKRRFSLDDYIETLTFETPESACLFENVMHLPDNYRIVIHLFYYEDYSVKEIADILKISESNVKARLSRGRAMLKTTLKEVYEND